MGVGPGPWAAAYASGDRDAYRRATARTIEAAQIAESLGVDSFWALEDPDGWDAFAVLSAVAQATERIRLGTGVTNPYYRHPALMAASIATLDAMSGGRAFLGLGRGQREWYENALGIAVGNPVHALRETIDLLRQWQQLAPIARSPETATEFHVTDWRRGIAPMQEHLPIYLAAAGPQALRVAGELADGVIFNDLSSRQFMRDAITRVRDAATAADRDPSAIRFIARADVRITDDPEPLYEQRKSTVAMIHALPGMERLLVTPGFDTEAIIAEVRRIMHTDDVLAEGGAFADLREAGDLDAAKRAIPTALMEHLVFAGTVPQLQTRLQDLVTIGVTDVFLALPTDARSIAPIAELIAPFTG